jgi:O-antigen/teichoic acid export membrane protein
VAFALKVAGAGLGFAFTVAVAQVLGARGAGLYFLALSAATIGAVLGRFGLDLALLRHVAVRASQADWAGLRGVHDLGLRLAAATSSAVSALLFLGAAWVANELFKKPELAQPLRLMSLSIVPFALLNLQAESLKGLKRVGDAIFVQAVGVPLIGLALILPMAEAAGVNGATLAYLTAVSGVTLIAFWAWRRATAGYPPAVTALPTKGLLASCQPLLLVSLVHHAVLPWAPLFLLGIWASSAEVGVFGAASRVALLVSFMHITLNNVVAPKFAELYAKGDLHALGATARHSTFAILLLTSPLLLLLLFGGEWIMALFGPGFDRGALPLAILAVGQFFTLASGSAGHLLMMSGNERVYSAAVVLAGATQLLLGLFLIPVLGSIGAALATALTLAGLNLLSAMAVRRRLGIRAAPWLGV